ncbi:phage protein [Escherichia coli]|nr:phage protein [Escherichia coli]
MAVIYIAGPMTGYKDHNRTAFFTEAMRLAADGHVVLNPATLPEGLSQQQYMSICIPMLMCADAIYLLEGWVDSAGARAEYVMALKTEHASVIPGKPGSRRNRRAAASQIKSHTGD